MEDRSTVLQDISAQVICGICSEHFQIPKTVIPCLHNFCTDCLQCTIESRAQPKIGFKQKDPQIFAIFTFPCPSCRGNVEFPVRTPRPWDMKKIAEVAAQKDFKTNFVIENQLDIINKKSKTGCQQHQGEVRMWFCRVCQTIICQFCVQENHKPPNHEIALVNKVVVERRQEISIQKEAMAKKASILEGKRAEVQSYLENIHVARSCYEDKQKLFTNELQTVREELNSLENEMLTQRHGFDEQMTSNEIKMLKVFQKVSEGVDDCKWRITELDKKLSVTDLDLVGLSKGSTFEGFAPERSEEFTSIPTPEIPQLPALPIDLMRQGVWEIKNILRSVTRDLKLSPAATASAITSSGNQQLPPEFTQPGGSRSPREPKKVFVRASQVPEVTLKKSENPWKPRMKEEKTNLSEERTKTKELIRKFTSILNKLTVQNFQTLMSKTLQLPIDNEERLTAVIDLVFEKAITEPHFSTAYANMCRVLSQIKVPAANTSGIVQFRTVLINKCQRTYEAEKKDEATWAELKEEIYAMEEGSPARQAKEQKLFILQKDAKQKVLGNIRFIGELFKLRMLTENIMHECIFKLLRAKDDLSLECMSQLMNTVGKDLDHERAKDRMDQYFTSIAKIISNKKIPPRITFMLQDVQHLRKSNWVPRRDDNNPKTIAQIHQEAKQEEQQKKIETQLAFHASNKSREKSGRGRPTPLPQQDRDWQTVAVSNKGRPQIDPSESINMGKNRPNNDNVQLGPGGQLGAFCSWGIGSSVGGAKMQSSDQVDLRPVGNNRYAMLLDQGRNRPGMAPPTRDSKGRPTGPIPTRRSRERDEGRSSSREDSIKRERMHFLDEVQRTMGGGGGARSRSTEKDRKPSRDRVSARGSREGSSRGGGSREGVSRGGGSRDRSGSREAASPSPLVGKSAPKPAGPQLSDEEYEKKGRATLDEYLNIMDFNEACTCLSELNSPDKMHLFVRLSIEHVLKEDARSRLATGALFHRLIIENILSVQQYLQGLNEILEFADYMAIDIPLIWQYLGEVMGSMIRDKSQSLKYLGKALEPVKVSGKAGVLLAEILLTAEKNIGAEDLIDLWQSAGFRWEQFLPDDVNVSQFVNSKKLDYTLQKSTQTSQKSISSRSESDSLARMVSELGFMLASDKCVNDDIFEWIKKNIDPERIKQKDFIRALVTVVCESTMEGDSSRCDPGLLTVRAKSLLRYIDGDVDRELQALFAVQALNHKLVNPPGFLRLIFDVLYDEDVISEETFYAWQNSSDPAEQAGKGVALKAVTTFFAWLDEAEDDSES